MPSCKSALLASVIFLSTTFSTGSLWACAAGNHLRSISPDQNGVTKINLSIQQWGREVENVIVDDNDGMATVAILYFSLIQNVSDGLWSEKIKWDDIQLKPVSGWNLVGNRIVTSLEKVAGKYKEWSVLAPRYLESIELVTPVIAQLKGKTPTYLSLSDSLGKMLFTLARKHSYLVQIGAQAKKEYRLVENDARNPIGGLLVSHPFTLPPEFMSSCSSPLNVDLRNILK